MTLNLKIVRETYFTASVLTFPEKSNIYFTIKKLFNGKKIVGKNNKVLVKGAAYLFSKTNWTARNQLPLTANQFFFSI